MRLLVMEGCANITATFKEKILQGWNFIGPGGIFLPWSDIPELFTWVNKGGKINFQVPQNIGSNVIAFTLCFTCFHIVHFNRSYFANDPDVLVTNHTKRTCFWTAPFYRDRKDSTLCEHLWLGHLPNFKFNMEGGDLVEVLVRTVSPYFKVKRTGLSLVWDTKQADFRVDANWVDKMCSSRPYVGGPADYDDEHKQYVL
ncbi:hypothetical protein M0R45_025008 [Rubus argutus]|uniref:DUF4283 domain-containing protein n=1 Tax=Rubus argutus TaxID=59490 RepID=A0AAW1WWR0_RUBAR